MSERTAAGWLAPVIDVADLMHEPLPSYAAREIAADILEHLHDLLHMPTPEGQAYRDALGLTIDTRYGVTRNRGDIGSFVPCENKRMAKWTSQDWGAPFTEQQRVVSEWRECR